MTRVQIRGLAVLAAAMLGGITLHASSPRFFEATTQGDFLKGDVDNLSIDSEGRLFLGPATDLIYETPAPFLWSLVAGTDGSLFVGTGNEGKVYRIDPQGKGSLFFTAAELEAHALAPAPDGGLFVATSPDGKIYKVNRNGTATPFFDPGEKYIWSLALDAKGNLYAGTGEKGVIYKIGPDGHGAPFYKTRATNATALAIDASGNLLVGTAGPAKVFRISPDGKAFVLFDSSYQEIHALRFDNAGMLYVAALSGQPPTAGPPPVDERIPERPTVDTSRAPVPSVSAEITSMSIVEVGGPANTGSTHEDQRAPKGAVYRIAPDGAWDLLWESRDDVPYALAFDEHGAVVIGTGGRGKLYRLDGEPLQPTLLTRAPAQQVTAFYRNAKGQLYYATANPGKLFRLSPERSARGSYESDAQDAQVISAWGMLSWHGVIPSNDQIALSTRSGNTSTPDDTWSDWSTTYATPDGSHITSPKARYLQWRAVLSGKGDGPVLTSVTAAYLQRNLRPVVHSITVYPPGIVFQKPYTGSEADLAGFEDQTTPERKLAAAAANVGQGSSTPPLGRRTYQKGLQTLAWKADDENDDELSYDVLYRREGETTWKVLRKDVTDPLLVWDTTTVPNGTYFVKIVASDLPSNPPTTALAGELESSAFEIDNTPPQIIVDSVTSQGGRTVVAFHVTDDHSPIQKVEFSTDGEHWRSIFPQDGIADSKEERFDLVVDGGLSNRGGILRASDTMNNVATAHVDIPPAK